MKIRSHRGGLAESMLTVAKIDATADAVAAHINEEWKDFGPIVTTSMVRVEKYGIGIDKRIGWDTHIVLIENFGPFGFTDSPLTHNVELSSSPATKLETERLTWKHH